MEKKLVLRLTIAIILLVLALSLRGNPGNPQVADLDTPFWKEEGPLELSPERGRFGLTYSIIEDKSVHFSIDLARFITPDVGYANGRYVSLFAPGVSYLVSPGYVIGKIFGASQVGAFAAISLFAFLNFLFIRSIANHLGASQLAATVAGLIFLFATPAFAYAVSLYQHHISTFLILASLYLLIRFNSLKSLAAIWFLSAASIVIDYPNLFLMFPIGIAALSKLVQLRKIDENLKLKINLRGLLTVLTVFFPLLFFMWFNHASYGNPLQFSGTIKSAETIDAAGNPQKAQNSAPPSEKSSIGFFNTRNMITGAYTHIISLDRGIIIYTPVILLGIVGVVIVQKNYLTKTLISIAAVNLILYSMWGDPYGGWAFGARYLIPGYAIMAIFIGIALTHFSKKKIFLIVFLIFATFSIFVNTLGAITSSQNPPKVEAIPLSQISGRREPYTPERNLDFLKSRGSKSFAYKTFFENYLRPQEFYLLIATVLTLTVITLALIL